MGCLLLEFSKRLDVKLKLCCIKVHTQKVHTSFSVFVKQLEI